MVKERNITTLHKNCMKRFSNVERLYISAQTKSVTPPTRGNMTPARITGGDPKG